MYRTCLCVVEPDIRLVSLQGKAAAMHKHSYTAIVCSAAEVQLHVPQTTAQSSESCKLSGC